jgi:DNA transposition AAA+ family ATPase
MEETNKSQRDGSLSNVEIKEIRERLKTYMKENPSVSNRVVANNIGFSTGYVSLFINDKFPSDPNDLAIRIKDWLNKEQSIIEEAVSNGHLKFAMTTASQDIFKIANFALTEQTIGVVAGVPGCGKTIAVEEYAKRNRTSILIQVTPLVTQKSIIQDISLALKIPIYISKPDREIPISNNILFDEIILRLKGTRRDLIIDEAENLSVPCIEIIRRIQDFTHVGILLSGTPKILDRIRGPRKELQQLFSRVGIWKEILLLTEGDVKAIMQINYPEAIKFSKTFLQLSKNNGRLLEHLITLVKRMVADSGEELSDDLIDDAAGSLLT